MSFIHFLVVELIFCCLPQQRHVVETYFGFDEESADSETSSLTSFNTDVTDRTPATPEEDLEEVRGSSPVHLAQPAGASSMGTVRLLTPTTETTIGTSRHCFRPITSIALHCMNPCFLIGLAIAVV